jgi:hypothetical protein
VIDDETRAHAIVIVMKVFGAAYQDEEWTHESAATVIEELEAAGLLADPFSCEVTP